MCSLVASLLRYGVLSATLMACVDITAKCMRWSGPTQHRHRRSGSKVDMRAGTGFAFQVREETWQYSTQCGQCASPACATNRRPDDQGTISCPRDDLILLVDTAMPPSQECHHVSSVYNMPQAISHRMIYTNTNVQLRTHPENYLAQGHGTTHRM